MFPIASIAFTFTLLLSASRIAIRGAPLSPGVVFRGPFACTGLNGTGTCTPLRLSQHEGTGLCTNVDNVTQSLKLVEENECAGFQQLDCDNGGETVGDFFLENPTDSFVNIADEFTQNIEEDEGEALPVDSVEVCSFLCPYGNWTGFGLQLAQNLSVEKLTNQLNKGSFGSKY
ncbi:hypothetical protein B0H13DRAFT_1869275 [Mycena leptocephala]|nr:hypothetical protein B0H13DRAFT_1869275 [Mycena leptocephala]